MPSNAQTPVPPSATGRERATRTGQRRDPTAEPRGPRRVPPALAPRGLRAGLLKEAANDVFFDLCFDKQLVSSRFLWFHSALCMLFGLRNHARSGRYPYAAMPGIVVSGSLSPEPSDRANRSVRCENMDTLAAPPVRALAGRLLATIA